MNYKTLGRSGLRVSPICLGGMTFGEDLGWGADEVESEKMIKRFMELGGNFIDTANVYTNNHSEKIIGNVIGRHSSIRAGMVLATKFGMNVFPGNPNGGGNGTKAIMENVHHSLRRVQSALISHLSLHGPGSTRPPGGHPRTIIGPCTDGRRCNTPASRLPP